jgi:hypothetical protein
MATRSTASALKQAISRNASKAAPSAAAKRSYVTMQTLERANEQEIARYAAGGVAALVVANAFVVWTEIKDPSNAHWRSMSNMRPKAETAGEETQEQLVLHHENEYSAIMNRSRHPIVSWHLKL